MLAQGGIVTGPTLALIGESGPEAVVPLNGSGRGSVGGNVYITIENVNGTDKEAARKLCKEVMRELKLQMAI
jgi:phage-related minor tail protein